MPRERYVAMEILVSLHLLTYFVFEGEEGHGESAPMDVEVRGQF